MVTVWSRCALTILLFSAGSMAMQADDTSSKRKSKSTKKSATAEQTEERLTGRLPRYFSSIVDQEQRAEIYAIQRSYQERIDELEKELAELEESKMEEIEDVLTSAQQKELADLREKGNSKSRTLAKSRTPAKSSKTGATKSASTRSKSRTSRSSASKQNSEDD